MRLKEFILLIRASEASASFAFGASEGEWESLLSHVGRTQLLQALLSEQVRQLPKHTLQLCVVEVIAVPL